MLKDYPGNLLQVYWNHRLDEHRGSAQKTELVGNSVDRSGGGTDCARISCLGGLRLT